MKFYVGITDGDWFRHLSSDAAIDEVNFWQPSGKREFKVLAPGEPFLFKLHSPNNHIVGGGFFGHHSVLPVSLAWEVFETKNGAKTETEMRARIERYRRTSESKGRLHSWLHPSRVPVFFKRETVPVLTGAPRSFRDEALTHTEPGLCGGEFIWRCKPIKH
jgi:putative restriction endonuclease